MSKELVVEPAKPPGNGQQSVAGWLLFVDIISWTIWVYALTNTFITNIDGLVFKYISASYSWLWNFKFLFFFGIVAAIFILDRMIAVFVFLYVAFFPFVILFWKLPKLLIRIGSWSLVLGIANAVISYFRDLRYKIIASFLFALSFTAAAISIKTEVLIAAAAIQVAILLTSYYRCVKAVFTPDSLFEIYRKLFAKARGFVSNTANLEEDIKTLPVEQMSTAQLTKWSQQLGQAVLFNRACLFAARKLQRFHRSGFALVSGALTVMFLIIITTLSFAVVNYALYEADAANFETVATPSLATFVFYSFNALVNNFIREITPSSITSHFVWMSEVLCAVAILVIFAANFLSFKTNRYAEELAETAKAIENEGKFMEGFVSQEWRLSSIDEAMRELERAKWGLLSTIIWLTENAKP